MKTLDEIVRELPPDLQREVRDFAEFLLEKHASKPVQRPTLDWIGAAREAASGYTSVDLQHKSLEWRIQEALEADEVPAR